MIDKMTDTHLNNLKDFEVSLKAMCDEEVLKQLGKLFRREKNLADAILINLQETYYRRLYAKEGYSSMFEMLVKRFGHSESAAYQRVSALKLIQAVPSAKEALAKGETTLTTMADTQKFITRMEKETPLSSKEKETIFNQVKGKTQREALSLFAELNPIMALPETKEKPLTAQHTLLQVTVDQETLKLLNELKALLSHEIPDGNLNQLLKRIATVGLEQLKKAKGRSEPKNERPKDRRVAVEGVAVVDSYAAVVPRTQNDLRSQKLCDNKNNAQNVLLIKQRKTIPLEIRRQVYARAQHRCEYVGTNGNRCGSQHQLEVDHIVPWSQGGSDQLNNLQALCRPHNCYRTRETHGFWFKPKLKLNEVSPHH